MKAGDLKNIYQHWQSNERFMGVARLIEKKRNGLSFINEDYIEDPDSATVYRLPDSLTPVYNYERWVVEFVNLSPFGTILNKVGDKKEVNIRYLERIGLSTGSKKDYNPIDEHYPLVDRFIEVDGIEVF